MFGDLRGEIEESLTGESNSSLFGVLLRPNGPRLVGLVLRIGDGDLKSSDLINVHIMKTNFRYFNLNLYMNNARLLIKSFEKGIRVGYNYITIYSSSL